MSPLTLKRIREADTLEEAQTIANKWISVSANLMRERFQKFADDYNVNLSEIDDEIIYQWWWRNLSEAGYNDHFVDLMTDDIERYANKGEGFTWGKWMEFGEDANE